MARVYKKLKSYDRRRIEKMYKQGLEAQEIADKLGLDVKPVSIEITRNDPPHRSDESDDSDYGNGLYYTIPGDDGDYF